MPSAPPPARFDLNVAEAIAITVAQATPTPSESVPVAEALGRVLREDLASLSDRPEADDSALDGFAVLASDTRAATGEAPVNLELIGESLPGAPFTGALHSGQAVKVATGSLMPAGADAVVGVEYAGEHREPTGAPRVRVTAPGDPRAVRPRGQDLRADAVYLRSGTRLTAAGAALAASMGHAEVAVARRPRVLVVVTGDELKPPGSVLSPGELFESNGIGMSAVLSLAGAHITTAFHARDDVSELADRVRRELECEPTDLIVSSGAVSRGERDVVRDLLMDLGSVRFWRVEVRPAGPTMLGSFSGVPWLGLPGNPVSSLVGCLLFALPFVQAATGDRAPHPYRRRRLAVVGSRFAAGGKEVLHRARIVGSGPLVSVEAFDNQSSGVLRSLVESDALVLVPANTTLEPARGDLAEVIELAPFLT